VKKIPKSADKGKSQRKYKMSQGFPLGFPHHCLFRPLVVKFTKILAKWITVKNIINTPTRFQWGASPVGVAGIRVKPDSRFYRLKSSVSLLLVDRALFQAAIRRKPNSYSKKDAL